MKKREDLTIADHELLHQAYRNLIDAGIVVDVVQYVDFIEAVLTGDTFDFEDALETMDDWLVEGEYSKPDSIVIDREWERREEFKRLEPLE